MAYSAAMPFVVASPRSMLRILSAALALVLAALHGSASAQAELPPPVAQALARAGIPTSAVGIFVQDLSARRPTLTVNAEQPMNPASTMKLVTTYAALELLGPAYSWKTEAYVEGPLKNGVLEGDLFVKGYGDPKLTIEDFWLFLRGMRARGLREIRGDLVLDRTWFEQVDHDPARFDGEPLRPYNAGADALLVNFKAVRFLFAPQVEQGTVRVEAEPRLPQLDLANNVRLTAGPCGDWRGGLRMDVQDGNGHTSVAFSGTMPSSCGERVWNVSLLGQTAYFGGIFRSLWEELGGTLRGSVRDGPVSPNARLFATQESPPLAELVRDVNKYSNNVMARQMFLTLSAEVLKLPGRADRSARALGSWLAQKNLQFPELVLENGSGLSRNERIAAGSLGRLLVSAWHSSVMPELMSSMPLVAHDGTMGKRLKFASVAGQAHLKTGSLTEVRSIAGYVLDRNGRRHAVVFIINHPNAAQGEAATTALIRWLYGEGRTP
ncbi:MAG: D-alanyl-D-alanine carboxypeptidase/D-alanyl-D-alanine-endopeptidase [Burkholderiales bacterium]